MNIASWGSLALGIVIAYLVRMVVRRFRSVTPKTLGAVVSVLLGGTVIRVLSAEPDAVWYYAIALLAGFVIYTIVAFWVIPRDNMADVAACVRPIEPSPSVDPGDSNAKPGMGRATDLPGVLLEPPSGSENDKTL